MRIQPDKTEDGNNLTKLAQYDNLGPVKDMAIVDLEKQGQGQLITASGVGNCGSLRIIRNGVGIHEYASIDLPGVKGLWSLSCLPASTKHDTLILAFVGQSLFLRLDGEEVSEIPEIPGFVSEEQTLHASNVVNSQLLQVTESGARLVANDELKDHWNPPDGLNINLCSANKTQVLLGVKDTLVYLEIEADGKLTEKMRKKMPYEIACVDLARIKDKDVCAFGLWNDISVTLLSLPDMECLDKSELGGEIIPRSVLLTTFSEIPYLFVSIGDGTLFYFPLENEKLGKRKRVQLGTQPTSLNKFAANSNVTVFACSDRPAVIHSQNQKIFFSNVNLKQVKNRLSKLYNTLIFIKVLFS